MYYVALRNTFVTGKRRRLQLLRFKYQMIEQKIDMLSLHIPRSMPRAGNSKF